MACSVLLGCRPHAEWVLSDAVASKAKCGTSLRLDSAAQLGPFPGVTFGLAGFKKRGR